MTPQEEYELGLSFFKGTNGREQDYAKAFVHFRNAAEDNIPDALNKLGVCYFNGWGTFKDLDKARIFLKQAASLGSVRAHFSLGLMYQQGEGVERDYAEAIKWYKFAAEQGNAYAQTNLGAMYEDGEGVERNYAEAIKWYKLAAEQGNAYAQFNLGVLFECGKGVEQDYAEAIKWYKSAAEQGDAEAQNHLGVMYGNGEGVERNYAEAIKWYRLAAEQGDADAQTNLGEMSRKGEGVERDYTEAIKWYKLAAGQGDAVAQNNLGVMYEAGEGVERDYAEAIKWYKLAAEQGTAAAQNKMGLMYYFGYGVERDYAESIKWYRLAAAQGNADAQNNIGVLYESGKGVERDYAESIKWYKLAAEQGTATAQNNIGVLYKSGKGVEQDYAEAIKWYKFAAEQGYAYAQLNLGLAYRRGEGVEQDYAEALKWYVLAANGGSMEAAYQAGLIYYYGKGVAQDYRMSFKLFRMAAKKGNELAQTNLGNAFCQGQGVAVDYSQAVFWWRKAARQGYRGVMYNLGCAYAKGLGVPRDWKRAEDWWTRAAELEDETARRMLDVTDSRQVSFQLNAVSEKDISALREKAEKGNPEAQVGLGDFFYAEGNNGTAADWYDKASRGNHAEAKFKLACQLFNNNVPDSGFTQDPRELMAESAALGYKRARMVLNVIESEERSEGRLLGDYELARICERPYYVDEIIFQKYGDTLSDNDLFRSLMVLYAFHTKQKLDFEDGSLPLSPSWDALLTKLYQRTASADSDFRREAQLLKAVSFLERDDFETQYRDAVLEIVQRKEGFLNHPVACPPPAILEQVAGIIKKKKKTSIYSPFAGAGLLSLFLPEDCALTVQDPSKDHSLLAELMADAAGLSSCRVVLSDPLDVWKTTGYDCVVCMTPIRGCSYAGFDVDAYQEKVMDRLLADGGVKDLLAIILTDHTFNTETDENTVAVRKKILSSGNPAVVEQVIEYPKGLIGDVDMNVSLLVISSCGGDSVLFESEGEKKQVSLDEIAAKGYSLNPRVYGQTPEKKKEGQEIVRLGDLLAFDLDGKHDIDSFVRIDDEDFSSSLLKVLGKKDRPQTANIGQETFWLKYKGPTIYLKFDGGIRIFCNNSDACFSAHDSGVALKAKDGYSPEYLSCLLLNDRGLARYLRSISDGQGGFNKSDFLNYEIPVYPGLEDQARSVDQALTAERQASESALTYNVVIISEECEDLSRRLNQRFCESSLTIQKKMTGLKEDFDELRRMIDRGKKDMDAILLDDRAECFEYIVSKYGDWQQKNVYLYLLSDKRIEDLDLRKNEKSYYVEGNRVFSSERLDGSLIAQKIRDDLDAANSPEAKVRSEHKKVFEAIASIDKKYGTHLDRQIIDFILKRDKIDDDPASGVCGPLRLAGHSLIKILQSKNLVPRLDPGAIPHLLADRTFTDNGIKYYLLDSFMPQHLAESLCCFVSVTNAGVHGGHDSAEIGQIALHILMAFILWFHEHENELVTVPGKFNWMVKDDVQIDMSCEYTVDSIEKGNKEYFFCENVHLEPQDGLAKGRKIRFHEDVKLSDENRPLIGNGLFVIFFARKRDYQFVDEEQG